MTNLGELFSLLLASERPSAPSQVLTRPAGADVEDGTVLAAVDSSGFLHLLIPAGSDRVPEDHKSQGVTLGVRKLSTDTGNVRYADLACAVPRLNTTFEQLAQDLVTRLQTSPTKPLVTIAKTLDDWRALLRTAFGGISRDEIVGLIGELEVLNMLASHNPIAALESWIGPSGATHDFAHDGIHLETKTTSSVSGGSVRISNLDQLDPSLSDDLRLAVVHVVESESAPNIDERLEAVAKLGVPEGELHTRVAGLGYIPGTAADVPTRFEVRGVQWWHVGDEFPGLRGSDLSPSARLAIDHVQYDLILASLDAPMSSHEVGEFIAGWMV